MHTSSPSSTLGRPAPFLDRAGAARIPSLPDEREPWNALAVEIPAHSPIVRVPGLPGGVAPLACLEQEARAATTQERQEAIAVRRGPGARRRRPEKGSAPPPATEAPAAPPVLPPVPGNPVKSPPKRPRPAPSAEAGGDRGAHRPEISDLPNALFRDAAALHQEGAQHVA